MSHISAGFSRLRLDGSADLCWAHSCIYGHVGFCLGWARLRQQKLSRDISALSVSSLKARILCDNWCWIVESRSTMR